MSDSSRTIIDKIAKVESRAGKISKAQEDLVDTVEWNNRNIEKIDKNVEFFKLLSETAISEESSKSLSTTNRILQHLKWIESASDILKGDRKPDDLAAGDSKSCELGQWLETEGRKSFRNPERYQSVVENHRLFHETLPKITENMKVENMESAYEAYNSLREYSSAILSGMLNFEAI